MSVVLFYSYKSESICWLCFAFSIWTWKVTGYQLSDGCNQVKKYNDFLWNVEKYKVAEYWNSKVKEAYKYLKIVVSWVNDLTGLHEASHLEVDFDSSSSHAQAEGGCINSTITFPKDEELILSETWELSKETLEGFVIIISDLREEHMKWKCSKCFKVSQQSRNSPGHHRWRTFGHQSRNIPHLQEILGTAHWQSCSSWMCSHTVWPRHHWPENESQQCLFRVTFINQFIGIVHKACSHEMVHSLTGIHQASCSLGLRSARAPEGLWPGLFEKSQTCRRPGPGLNTALNTHGLTYIPKR